MRILACVIVAFSFVFLQCKKSSEPFNSHTPVSYDHNRNPGNSAADFLGNTTYQSLKIEILYMPDSRPDPAAINQFTAILSERLNKPAGISVAEREIDPTLKTVFTPGDISGIESRSRTAFTEDGQMAACILFINGSYYSGNILGLAYKNTSICFFSEPLQLFTGSVPEDERVKLVTLVMVHEFGHLLGLVDMGTPMVAGHLDRINGNHCINTNCVMHHTYTPEVLNIQRIINVDPTFDSYCLDDLRGNGGK